MPLTVWLFDYPLFERTYYQLAVNFDVYGNVSHQLQTRLYFDLIRNGAEVNFLRLMPADQRKAILGDWYQNSGKVKMWMDYEDIDTDTPSGIKLDPRNPKRDFGLKLLQRTGSLNAAPDPINRCQGAFCSRPQMSEEFRNAEQSLSRLVSRPAAGLKVINQLPEATMLRIEGQDGQRQVYSLLRNRAHSNVAFLLGEAYRYQPGLDTLTLYPGCSPATRTSSSTSRPRMCRSSSRTWSTPKMTRRSSSALSCAGVCAAVTRRSGAISMT